MKHFKGFVNVIDTIKAFHQSVDVKDGMIRQSNTTMKGLIIECKADVLNGLTFKITSLATRIKYLKNMGEETSFSVEGKFLSMQDDERKIRLRTAEGRGGSILPYTEELYNKNLGKYISDKSLVVDVDLESEAIKKAANLIDAFSVSQVEIDFIEEEVEVEEVVEETKNSTISEADVKVDIDNLDELDLDINEEDEIDDSSDSTDETKTTTKGFLVFKTQTKNKQDFLDSCFKLEMKDNVYNTYKDKHGVFFTQVFSFLKSFNNNVNIKFYGEPDETDKDGNIKPKTKMLGVFTVALDKDNTDGYFRMYSVMALGGNKGKVSKK